MKQLGSKDKQKKKKRHFKKAREKMKNRKK